MKVSFLVIILYFPYSFCEIKFLMFYSLGFNLTFNSTAQRDVHVLTFFTNYRRMYSVCFLQALLCATLMCLIFLT